MLSNESNAEVEEALAADDAVTVRVALEMVRSAVMSMAPAEGREQTRCGGGGEREREGERETVRETQ